MIKLGMTYAPGLEGVIQACAEMLDVVEIEPQAFWKKCDSSISFDQKSLDFIQELPLEKIIHSIGLPIGGSVSPDSTRLNELKAICRLLKPEWVSEHLSFNQYLTEGEVINTGFMLPPLQNERSVSLAISNIKKLHSFLDKPILFETATNYLQPIDGELTDGEFFNLVAKGADCGILLDLHNIWANERNGRQPMSDLLQQIAYDRIIEIHLAGGELLDGYYLDAHSNLVPNKLLETLGQIISELPNLQLVTFEIMPVYMRANGIEISAVKQCLSDIKTIIETKRSGLVSIARSIQLDKPYVNEGRVDVNSISPDEWQIELISKILKKKSHNLPVSEPLIQDPGTKIYHKLIHAFRGGAISESLTLTCRLLRLTLGNSEFESLLEEFWRENPPELFASEEAFKLANYLCSLDLDVPYLGATIAIETASLRAILSNEPVKIEIECDPIRLTDSLHKAELPDLPLDQIYEVNMNP